MPEPVLLTRADLQQFGDTFPHDSAAGVGVAVPRMTSASVPISRPPRMTLDACAIIHLVVATAAPMSPAGASISCASWTGAYAPIPASVARQHARPSISAPLACIG